MRIGILTSSRADYGIYLPLLKELVNVDSFETQIIVFGSHLSKNHGYTITQIIDDGFDVIKKIETLPTGDGAVDISKSIGETIVSFADFWAKDKFDLIFALGDRFEMFAAVASTVPFNIKVAHIHGGETTAGAIDDVFRHSITSMSSYHFTATEKYKKRVIDLLNSKNNVFNVGALSIDNIRSLNLLSIEEFQRSFKIDLSQPTILITFHPETVNFNKSKEQIFELTEALRDIDNFQMVITMPNIDTGNLCVRNGLNSFINKTPKAYGVESLGTLAYLSCMKHCKMMIGNTSSGFIEASGFNKPVVNIGNRQEGRIITENIFNVPILKDEILKGVQKAENFNSRKKVSIYGDGHTAKKIVEILKVNSGE